MSTGNSGRPALLEEAPEILLDLTAKDTSTHCSLCLRPRLATLPFTTVLSHCRTFFWRKRSTRNRRVLQTGEALLSKQAARVVGIA